MMYLTIAYVTIVARKNLISGDGWLLSDVKANIQMNT